MSEAAGRMAPNLSLGVIGNCAFTRWSTSAVPLWWNFPQTYSMVGIINGATRLSRRRETVL